MKTVDLNGGTLTYDDEKYEYLNGSLFKKDISDEIKELAERPARLKKEAEEKHIAYLSTLLNKRILVEEKNNSWSKVISEIRIIEVSPSGQWVRKQNIHGLKQWVPNTEINVLEILGDYKPRE